MTQRQQARRWTQPLAGPTNALTAPLCSEREFLEPERVWRVLLEGKPGARRGQEGGLHSRTRQVARERGPSAQTRPPAAAPSGGDPPIKRQAPGGSERSRDRARAAGPALPLAPKALGGCSGREQGHCGGRSWDWQLPEPERKSLVLTPWGYKVLERFYS